MWKKKKDNERSGKPHNHEIAGAHPLRSNKKENRLVLCDGHIIIIIIIIIIIFF